MLRANLIFAGNLRKNFFFNLVLVITVGVCCAKITEN